MHPDEPDEALEAVAGQYVVALDYDAEDTALVLPKGPPAAQDARLANGGSSRDGLPGTPNDCLRP